MTYTLKQRSPRRNQPPASGRPAGLKLTAQDQDAICQALTDYQRRFADCFYRREQRHWSAVYLCGQLSRAERKTIEPMLLDLVGPDRNRHADGTPWSFALLTGSSSICHSLRAAIALAEHLGHERPDWELSAGRLADEGEPPRVEAQPAGVAVHETHGVEHVLDRCPPDPCRVVVRGPGHDDPRRAGDGNGDLELHRRGRGLRLAPRLPLPYRS